MNNKPNVIYIETGRETGRAFLDENSLSEYCSFNKYKIKGAIERGTSILNEKGAEIGYITKPGYGITLKDPDYKWIIVWT